MNTTVNPETVLSTRNLIDVGVQADDVRRRMHGARTTFVRVFEVHVDALPASIPVGTDGGRVSDRGAAGDRRRGGRRCGCRGRPGREIRSRTKGIVCADDGVFARRPDGARRQPSIRSRSSAAGFTIAGLEAIAEAPIDRLDDPASVVRAALDGGIAVPRLTVHSIPSVVGGTADPRIAIVERARDLQDVGRRLSSVRAAAADDVDRDADDRLRRHQARRAGAAGR